MSYTYIIKRGDNVWNAQRYLYSRSSLGHHDLENLKKNILDYENVEKTSLNHFAFITPSSAIFHFVPETFGPWTNNVRADADARHTAGYQSKSAQKEELDNSDAKSDTTDGSGGDAIIGLFD